MKTLKEIEREHVLQVLEFTNNDRSKAAKALGIGRQTLYRYLKQYAKTKHYPHTGSNLYRRV